MEGVLWYLLASSRGGPTRVRILRALDERPRNANQLATDLGYDYTTIRHHLDVLLENNVVRRTDDDYAAVYLLTDRVRANWMVVEEILDAVAGEGDREQESEMRTDRASGDGGNEDALDPEGDS